MSMSSSTRSSAADAAWNASAPRSADAPWAPRARRPSRPLYTPPVGASRRGDAGRVGTEKDGNVNPTAASAAAATPTSLAGRVSDVNLADGAAAGEEDKKKLEAYEAPVEVSGEDPPAPVEDFDSAGLPDVVAENVKRCGYARPTPVQRHALPILIDGRDLMACAQTGSGKTAAFCLPIVSNIIKADGGNIGRGGGRMARPLALVLAPTRELASQIHEEAKKFATLTGVRVAVAYGGTPIHLQLRDIERGVEFLVATPGRLVDIIERSRLTLRDIKFLALDEADRMLDMGFEPQIRKIIEQTDMPRSSERQTMLFSATFPDAIQRLASDFLTNYIFLTVGRVGSSTDLIAQKVEYVNPSKKRALLLELLRTQSRDLGNQALTVVFVETKREADSLEGWLSSHGFPATSIHGDRTQMERERALKSFKTGNTPIMVATDVAARGLDVPNVAHVINFDLPRDIDDYVHRIGRTGRAGKTGLATAFFSESNLPIAKGLSELMQEAKQEVPNWLLEYAAKPYNGGSSYGGRNNGGRFGGRDFRKGSSWGRRKYDDDIYGGSHSRNTDDETFSPYPGYTLGTEQITATGWD